MWLLLIGVFLAALALTRMVLFYAPQWRLMDIPNERSSHAVSTPKGGGLGLVIAFLAGLLGLWAIGALPFAALIALAGGGLPVAAIGLVDDRGHVAVGLRLAVHFLAAGWALAWLGGIPPLPIGDGALDFGPIGPALGLLFIVWLLNLYNFMDGIDGIAGVEAVTVAGGAALLYLLFGDGESWPGPAVLAMAAAGFLVWNWPPASIFMGDVGSGFVGYALAVFALSPAGNVLNPWVWGILLGVFLADATFTLVRRLLTGQRVSQAHRVHAYQHAARRFQSHRTVTLAVAGINLFWLLPLAGCAARWPGVGPWLFALAYLPLLGAAVWLGAGTARGPAKSVVSGI